MHPISLFVGRNNETKLVLDKIASSNNTRMVIEGAAGVGKTTFIHHLKYIMGEKNSYLTFYDHIRITQDYTSSQFVIDLIHNILLALYRNHPKRIKEFEKNDTIQSAKRLIMESVESQWGVGASVFGFGGSLSKSKSHIIPFFQAQQFYNYLDELMNAIYSFGFKGIIIQINNLENLCSENPDIARNFFNDIRDFLLIPGYHFLFGAKLGFTDDILGKDERVRSIFPVPILLESLTTDEIFTVLAKRYKYLEDKKSSLISPVEDLVIEKYHQLFQGNLRSMLSTMSDAIELRGQLLQPALLTYEAINPLLKNKYQRYIEAKFTEPAWNLLLLLKDEKKIFRQTDLSKEKTGLSQGRISQICTELESGGGIICTQTKGRSKYYDLSGISKIAFGIA